MNDLFDQAALWIYREPRAFGWLVGCGIAAVQTYVIFGR